MPDFPAWLPLSAEALARQALTYTAGISWPLERARPAHSPHCLSQARPRKLRVTVSKRRSIPAPLRDTEPSARELPLPKWLHADWLTEGLKSKYTRNRTSKNNKSKQCHDFGLRIRECGMQGPAQKGKCSGAGAVARPGSGPHACFWHLIRSLTWQTKEEQNLVREELCFPTAFATTRAPYALAWKNSCARRISKGTQGRSLGVSDGAPRSGSDCVTWLWRARLTVRPHSVHLSDGSCHLRNKEGCSFQMQRACAIWLTTPAVWLRTRVLKSFSLPGPFPLRSGRWDRRRRYPAAPTQRTCRLQVGCSFTYLGALVSFSNMISKRTASGRRHFQEWR